jgi:isocitrate dehydrogenase
MSNATLVTDGIEPKSWESLRRTKVFFKAPITPQGGGSESLNVTALKIFGPSANVRPCVSYQPVVKTKLRELTTIDNRGVKVWPDGMSETLCTYNGKAGYTLAQGQ